MRRALAAAAVAALALSGCAGSDEPSPTAEETPAASAPSETPSESAEAAPSEDSAEEPDDGQAFEIEIEGDRIEPMGKRVKVAAGEPITLKIESDRAAELHVHSSPEQELEVEKGESTLRLTIETPGIVDMEEHESGTVVYQFEVR